ncbi:unnamed protein product, partial [Nesidiocoris tenuis]
MEVKISTYLQGKTKILRPKTLKSVHFCGRKNKIENTKNANISEVLRVGSKTLANNNLVIMGGDAATANPRSSVSLNREQKKIYSCPRHSIKSENKEKVR